jgi:hypothetical protein
MKDSAALGFRNRARERRVLPELVLLPTLARERLAYLWDRSAEYALPLLRISPVNAALGPPPGKGVMCLRDHRSAQPPSHGVVVSKVTSAGMAASLWHPA